MSDEATKKTSPFAEAVGKLIGEFERCVKGQASVLSRSDISKLKRMDTDVPTVSFWRLLASVSTPETPTGDARWALVVKCMALMSPNIHSSAPSCSPGLALRDVGYSASSDLRISRLLKAEGRAFEDYLISAVRYLANKAQPVNWFRFAEFVFFQTPTTKNRLAKDFYSQKD
jgi:CRISPR type I-E-associated protein CasB/Cse2